MGYEKRIYMRIKDAMLKEHVPKKYRKREKTMGTLMPAKKERKQWVLRHPPVKIKIAQTLKDFKKREVWNLSS
jgi:hypothetical protein